MKRGKILVVAGMGLTAVVVVIAAVVMFRGLSAAAETRRERDESRAKLEDFFRRKPFPSAANIERETANVATVKEWYGTLLSSLKASTVPLGEPKPSLFNSRREAMMAELVSTAPIGVGGKPVVASDFGFGFDKYKTGLLANPRDVPRLMRQLDMVSALVKEMYGAGVLQIASVVREEFESGAEEEAPEPAEGGGGRGGRRGGRGGSSQEEPSAPLAVVGGRVAGPVPMDRQKFSFELTANEVALVDLLNRIARMPMFTVVTKLSVSKEGPDYVLAPSREAEAAAAVPGAPAVANPLPLSRTSRIVSGRDREARIKVFLDVEVFSFEGEG